MIHTVKGFSVLNEAEIDVFSGIPLLSLWSNELLLLNLLVHLEVIGSPPVEV